MNKMLKEMKINLTSHPYLLTLFIIMLSLLSILIGFSVIFSSLQSDARDNFYSTYGKSKVFKITDIASNECFDRKFNLSNMDNIKNLYDELEDKYDFIIQINQGFEASYNPDLKDFIINKSFSEKSEPVIYKSIRVNDRFFSYYDISVNEGRSFKINDYSYELGNKVPIILGEKYSDYFKVGDTISGNYMLFPTDTKYEIIGFLSKEAKVLNFDSGNYIDLSDYIIIPSVLLDKNNAAFEQMIIANYSQIIPNTIVTEHGINQELNELFTKYSMSEVYQISEQNKIIEDLWTTYSNIQIIVIYFLIFITLFCVLLVISTYIQRIQMNFERYAIHISLGASKKNIINIIISDLFLLLFISNSFGLISLRVIDNIIFFGLNVYITKIFAFLLFFDLCIVLICYFSLFFRLRKLKVGQFIRRLQA